MPRNSRTVWTLEEEEQLRQNFMECSTMKEIAKRHGRTEQAIIARLAKIRKVEDVWTVIETPIRSVESIGISAPLKEHMKTETDTDFIVPVQLAPELDECTLTDILSDTETSDILSDTETSDMIYDMESELGLVPSEEETPLTNCILVIDTETTGKDVPFVSVTNSSKWAGIRLVQFGYELYTEDHQLIHKGCWIIRPDGFTIPEETTAIHGISTEQACQEGVPIDTVFTWLELYLPSVTTLVAHNMEYDNNVMLSELFRYHRTELFTLWQQTNKDCTMLMGKRYLGRSLRLGVLAHQCGLVVPEGLHRADVDVAVCAQIYLFLLQICVSNQKTVFTISHADREVFKLLGGKWNAGQQVWTMDESEPYYKYAINWFAH